MAFLAGLFMFPANFAFSQDIQFWASTGMVTHSNKGFKNFADNFNRYNSAVIDKPLGGFGIGRSLNFGATLSFGNEGGGGQFSLFTNNVAAKAKVTFAGDERRMFALRRHLAGIEWSYGPRFGKSSLYFGAGFLVGNTILDCYFIYADGTESHGRERVWNGIYQGLNSSAFLSAKYEWRASERFSLFARLSYGGDMGKKAHLSDRDTRRGWTESWIGSTMLPLSVGDYLGLLDVPNVEPYDGPWVMNKFGSLNLQVGVGFVLFKELML